MKVPIRYKSSDRYNAGVDVVYDDESKLQYAPFIYATTASGDNGSGEDEEGEDTMVVNIAYEGNNAVLDKNWSEIKDALDSGKFAYLIDTTADETTTVRYITSCEFFNNTYIVLTKALDVSGETTYESSSATGVLVNSTGD